MILSLLIVLNFIEYLGAFNISPSLVLIFPFSSTTYPNLCRSPSIHTGQQLKDYFGIWNRLYSMASNSKRLPLGISQHILMLTGPETLLTGPETLMIALLLQLILVFWDTISSLEAPKNNRLLHVHLQRLNTDP
jgi:hypothetical protein